MAEINIEKKNAIWPWILAAIIVLVLIWLLIEAFDSDGDTVATTDGPVAATPATTAARTDDPAMGAATITDATTATGTDLERFAGMYSSSNMQLALAADGTYSMQESPAGEGRGTWTHDAGANALHLTPADGTPDRYFRVEGNDTLMPLNPDGEPAGQMAQLTRQAAE